MSTQAYYQGPSQNPTRMPDVMTDARLAGGHNGGGWGMNMAAPGSLPGFRDLTKLNQPLLTPMLASAFSIPLAQAEYNQQEMGNGSQQPMGGWMPQGPPENYPPHNGYGSGDGNGAPVPYPPYHSARGQWVDDTARQGMPSMPQMPPTGSGQMPPNPSEMHPQGQQPGPMPQPPQMGGGYPRGMQNYGPQSPHNPPMGMGPGGMPAYMQGMPGMPQHHPAGPPPPQHMEGPPQGMPPQGMPYQPMMGYEGWEGMGMGGMPHHMQGYPQGYPMPDHNAAKRMGPEGTVGPDGTTEWDADDQAAHALKRPRLVWTPQLHKRFVDAITQLGLKNAVPKTIMQVMNVDGLTRENVASHLQKYRLHLKRSAPAEEGEGNNSDAVEGGSGGKRSAAKEGEGSGDGGWGAGGEVKQAESGEDGNQDGS